MLPHPSGGPTPGLLPTLRLIPLVLTILIASAGCGEREDWSPLDGPWDPDHPDAARILAPPDAGDPIDREMADAGERWYRVRGCLACHALEEGDVVGPPMAGITQRRDYEWFRGMVMRPDSMLRVDPVAQELLQIYRIPMPDQGVDELRTRAMWEFLRERDRRR
jgi:hypothetical protein